MAAATFLQSRLEAEREKPQTSLDLLGNLHSIALALMEFDDHLGDVSPTARAAELFQYSLDNFGEDPAVRERLSAALRTLGKLSKSAEELFKVIKTLEEEGTVDDETLCMLYLDLGFLIDDIMPLPGAGYELETVTSYDEKDAPKLTFQREEIIENVNDGEITYQLETRVIPLSSFDCYRNAIRLDPTSGLAHKKLADAMAIIGKEGANSEFEIAAKYLPGDICCATHLHFASMQNDNQVAIRQAIPLKKDMALGKTLDDICVDFSLLTTSSLSSIAAKFETNGVLVFPEALSLDDVNVLSDKLDEIMPSITDGDGDCTVSDFTDETKASKRRIHMALPLVDNEQCTKTISNLLGRLHPLLALILQCNSGNDDIPLIGSGFMQTSPNASGQDLHKDVHHLDRHEAFDGMPESWNCSINGYPRCISIQVQLTDTTLGGKMGSLEVLPGSHRPDTGISPTLIAHALRDPNDGESGVIPVNVVPGTVTIYSSRLWHRGGANESKQDRRFCFFTATENQKSAPPGLIHTMQMNDVGKWRISGYGGLEKK
jgi:ectoine hydroxylase-related dioxygenase (phytanoyl-CoA dioxygenase family)